MTEFIFQMLYMLLLALAGYAVIVLPLWKALKRKMWHAVVLFFAFALFLSVAFIMQSQFWGVNLQNLQNFNFIMTIPQLVSVLILFRTHIWHTIFLYATAALYSTVYGGIGFFTSETWLVGLRYPTVGAFAVTAAVISLTLPPLLYMLRRLCESPSMKGSKIWKLIWVLPLLFFVMVLFSGRSFVFAEVVLDGFLVIRLAAFVFMFLIIYILESTSRQAARLVSLTERARRSDMLLDKQRIQYKQLMSTVDDAKKIQHDRRHHIAVLGQLAQAGDIQKIHEYIENLQGSVNALSDKTYCENIAVNAIAAHYLGAAEREGVAVSAQMVLPEDTGDVPAIDLCVIIGNLLENALNACRRMEPGTERFIRIISRVKGNALTIVVENSRGDPRSPLRSPPQDERREGVGLFSIKAVCEKHQGIVRIESDANMWKVSALVEMGERKGA